MTDRCEPIKAVVVGRPVRAKEWALRAASSIVERHMGSAPIEAQFAASADIAELLYINAQPLFGGPAEFTPPAEVAELRAERDAAGEAWKASERRADQCRDTADDCRAERDDLRADNARLREALEPFAAMAAHFPTVRTYGNRPTSGAIYSVVGDASGEPTEITVEHLHAARAALEPKR